MLRCVCADDARQAFEVALRKQLQQTKGLTLNSIAFVVDLDGTKFWLDRNDITDVTRSLGGRVRFDEDDDEDEPEDLA